MREPHLTHLITRPQASSKNLTSRHLQLLLRKKEKKAEYWPRLTKEKVRNAFIKTDFAKWVDEDEQDGEPMKAFDDDFDGGFGGGNMDFNNVGIGYFCRPLADNFP